MDSVQEIKSRLSIEEVVEKYTPLIKAGRNFKALCPFHNDHNPSLVVSPEKGLAWCFSCQAGGDIFGFLQRVENVDFPEALKILAEMAGVELPKQSGEKRLQKEKKLVLLDILEQSQAFFVQQLSTSKKARSFIEQRNLSPQIIKTFGLGYAPDDFHSLEKHLLQQGVARKEMLEAGIVATSDDKGENVYDRFRHRITFPIHDAQGLLRGFGGRIISSENPKYLNSPETPLYEKSHILYGMHLAKEAIKKENYTIVVEGYFDVLACHNAGIHNVVATCGTALTEAHVKLLQRFSNTLAFCFDADQAGIDAAKRATAVALSAGATVTMVNIPDGKDPDESLRENPEKFITALEERIPLMDFVLSDIFARYKDISPETERKILDEFFPFLALLPKSFEQDRHLQKLLNHFRMAGSHRDSGDILRKEFKKFQKKDTQRSKQPEASPKTQNSFEKITPFAYLIGLISSFPEIFSDIQKEFFIDLAPAGLEKKIYKAFVKAYNAAGLSNPQSIVTSLFSQEEAKKWELWSLYAEAKNDQLPTSLCLREAKKIIKNLNIAFISRELQMLNIQLKEVTKGSNEQRELTKKHIDFTRLLHQI